MAMHLVTNFVPEAILAELVIFRRSNKPHESLVGFGPRRWVELILGVPVDQLRTATLGADTGIVQMCLDSGNVMGRSLHGPVTIEGIFIFRVVVLVGGALASSGEPVFAILIELISVDVVLPVRSNRNSAH